MHTETQMLSRRIRLIVDYSGIWIVIQLEPFWIEDSPVTIRFEQNHSTSKLMRAEDANKFESVHFWRKRKITLIQRVHVLFTISRRCIKSACRNIHQKLRNVDEVARSKWVCVCAMLLFDCTRYRKYIEFDFAYFTCQTNILYDQTITMTSKLAEQLKWCNCCWCIFSFGYRRWFVCKFISKKGTNEMEMLRMKATTRQTRL